MATFLPSATEQFDDLKSEMIMTLELQRGEGCDVDGVQEMAEQLAHVVHGVVDHFRGVAAVTDNPEFGRTFENIENLYQHWRALDDVFQDTLGLAYRNRVPRHNLMLNQAHADLRRRVGGPIAELYTRVRSEWRRHVAVRPWDEHRVENRPHLDARKLDDALTALARGDELDAEDAINNLCGPLRSAFADFLTTNPDTNDLEVGLWRRPELLVAAEYWTSDRQVPLIQALAKTASPRFGVAFSTLSSFFEGTAKIGRGDDGKPITDKLARVPEAQRERFFRCLLMHPSYEMRRYAANNVTIDSYWQVLTTPDVPCATILTLLEQIVGSNLYTTSQRKVFFDVTYKRLLSVTAKSDVLYTRGIVRILSKLNFFLEDDYFSKLMGLLDYLVAKERHFGVEDSTLGDYISLLSEEKQRIGQRKSERPDFQGIPLVIQRKLARDGHAWRLFASHPIVKIATETVPHISTPDRCTVVARIHSANSEVLRMVGRQRNLFPTMAAKIDLLSNPHTPPAVSLDYLAELGRREVEMLLRKPAVHPELRSVLRNKFTQMNA